MMSKKKQKPEAVAPVKKWPKLPTKAQQEVLKNHGLSYVTWEVLQDMPRTLIIRHRITKEMKVVAK